MIVEYEPSRTTGPLEQINSCIPIYICRDSNDYLISDHIFWPNLPENKSNPVYDKIMAEIENIVKQFDVDVFWHFCNGNRWVGLRKKFSSDKDIGKLVDAYRKVKDIDWMRIYNPQYLK